MLKTNIIGAFIVCAILFSVVGFFFSKGLDLNWPMYFKVLSIIGGLALIVSIASLGKSSN